MYFHIVVIFLKNSQNIPSQGLYTFFYFGYNDHIFQKEAETMTERDTLKFIVAGDDRDMRQTLRSVYEALTEKGYNPINQIVGYLLTEDPTYITNYNNARAMICKIDRDELMQILVREYLFEKE